MSLVWVGALISALGEWTGFDSRSVPRRNLDQLVQRLLAEGWTPQAILGDLAGPATLRQRVIASGTIGETYFFRHPQHFEFLSDHPFEWWTRAELRAWSAGCATGEEAYSLAASLLQARPPGSATRIDVLGTDVDPDKLAIACRGTYGRWSTRAPAAWPALQPGPAGTLQVREEVRQRTRFQEHNLLDAAPPGAFDIILCRNVLMYLTPAARRGVVDRLTRSMAPGGLLMLATMDVSDVSIGLPRAGTPEDQIFVNAQSGSPPPSPPPTRPTPPARLRWNGGTLDRARRLIEACALDEAESVLSEHLRAHPDDLAAVVELALLQARRGDNRSAARKMHSVLRTTSDRPDDEALIGEDAPTVGYLRAVARAFLQHRSPG